MISLIVSDWQTPQLAAASRYKTTDRFILELYRDAKRRGFTHVSPVVYDARNGTLRQHVDAAKATGLRLIPWLIPGLLQSPLVAPMSAASVKDATWLIQHYWTGLDGLADGLVLEDDAGVDTQTKADFRAALSKVLPGVPLMVSIGCANDVAAYVKSVIEPRPVIVPQIYPLWRPSVVNAQNEIDNGVVLTSVMQRLGPLSPQDGTVWQGFGATDYALRLRYGVPNWHFAPRKGELGAWRVLAKNLTGPQFVYAATWVSEPTDPWTGVWAHRKLLAGKTFAQSRGVQNV